jgi:uncharacterized glyoxalase superfamily protein PhnB
MAKKKGTKKAKATGAQKRARASRAVRSRSRAVRKPAAARPTGMQSVSPGFTVNDANASMTWYCDVLGFSVGDRWEKDGVFLGGTVVQGPVTINIGQDDWKLGRDRKKGLGVRIYITTAEDIDTYAKDVKSRGGTLEYEPNSEWGFRTFSIVDPDGYKITFLRPLK